MKLIESKVEYLPQENGIEGIYKMIEVAGRTAYNSQDKITPDSAKNFVDRMIKSHHGACLEHGTVCLMIPLDYNAKYEGDNYAGGTRIDFVEKCPYYETNSYSKSSVIHLNSDMKYPNVPYGYNFKGGIKYQIVTTNFRVLQEHNWLDDLQYLCSPTEFHEKRYTMRFTCSRAIANELVRHRTMSFLQESTRYINYSKERHGGEITYIIPSWFRTLSVEGEYKGEIRDGSNRVVIGDKTIQLSKEDFQEHYFWNRLWEIENAYFMLLKSYEPLWSPQQARDVLPNATKTELIMTGFASDWKHLLDLRLFEKTGKVHPDMKDLMQKAQKAMQEAGIWEDIMKYPSKFE
jgi:thymidylate synthase (FAD)